MAYDLAAEPRRPRRWPWVLSGLVVLLVLAGAIAAAVTGRVLPYQADREELTGTPFVIRAQAGVPPDEEDRVRSGLVAIHAFVEEELGGGVDRAVQVRLTWSQGCAPLLGPTSVAPAWADDDLLCLNAAHPGWRRQVEQDRWYPAYVAAREHLHLWQRALGCHVEDGDHTWRWLYEGMTEHLAFTALDAAGVVDATQARAAIATALPDDPAAVDLADYARLDGPTDDVAGLFHLAARELATSAASPAAFADLCVAVGTGTPWRDAVTEAFGTDVDAVAARVAATLADGA